jgi:hypothetical protein
MFGAELMVFICRRSSGGFQAIYEEGSDEHLMLGNDLK